MSAQDIITVYSQDANKKLAFQGFLVYSKDANQQRKL